MMAKRTFAAIVGSGLLVAFSAIALAQEAASDSKPREKGIFDRIDDFGKEVFGGILPDAKKNKAPAKSADSRTRKPSASEPSDDDASGPRAGSIFSGGNQRPPAARKPVQKPAADDMEETPVAPPRREATPPRSFHRPVVKERPQHEEREDSGNAGPPAQRYPDETSRATNTGVVIERPVDAPAATKPASRPLHERMFGYGQSAFGDEPASEPRPRAERQEDSPRPQREREEYSPRPIIQQPREAERPIEVAERPALRLRSVVPSTTQDSLVPVENQPVASNANSDVLVARKGPVLSVETLGPRTISVGRESTYGVVIVNSGEVAADDLVLFVTLPEWAEVANLEASAGTVQPSAAAPSAGPIQWKVGSLNARGRQRLTLRIIPRQSRPFDLAVRWEYKPVASQAMIEVQEAKLSLQLEGPREVLYGKKELYRLRLKNTGTGSAENVAINLVPVGAGENMSASHKISVLAAGEQKVLDVELTARQAGDLTIRADVSADGGAHAELAEKVLVRRAELKVDIDGPKMQYVGVVATYAVRVRNPGTAPANNVHLALTLPEGAAYISGIEGAQADASNKLNWGIESLGPGAERTFTIKCRLAAAGTSRARINAAADDDLATSADAVVQVEAVANLTLNVKDPAAPSPVGGDTLYEVHVRNRGTKEAQGVEIFGYFSRGVEPTSAEGAPSRLAPGQIIFQPIVSLGPGEEITLKVHARADAAGNHVFRAEVHCKPIGARLISEATSLYYGDNLAAQSPSREPAAAPPPQEAMRPITGQQ